MKKFVMIPLMIVFAAFFTTIIGCAEGGEPGDQVRLGGDEQQEQQKAQQGQQGQQAQLQNSFRVSQLMDSSVQTQEGQDLGDVQDVVLDKQGRFAYIILSGSDVGKQDDQMVAVPLQAANPQMQNGNLVISLSQQQLANAPAFSKDNWAQLEQNRQQINAYFGGGMQGGQQDSMQRDMQQQQQQMEGQQTQQRQQPSQSQPSQGQQSQ